MSVSLATLGGLFMDATELERRAEPDEAIITDAAAYWGRSDCDSKVRENSHWAGEGKFAFFERWLRIGHANMIRFKQLCALANHPRPVRRMVEWGPGGGANALCFAREVERIYGVDISAPNLEECARSLRSVGFAGFRRVLIEAARPGQALGHLPEPVEFFLCTAVFQHFPSKAYGSDVTRIAYCTLTEPGIALIQTRYDDGSEEYRPKHRDYAKNVRTFTSYGIDEYWQIAVDTGFKPLAVILEPRARYAHYFLKK